MATDRPDIPTAPGAPPQSPRIGVDEWVASVDERRERYRGPIGAARTSVERIPAPALFLTFAVFAAALPFMTSNGYVIRVGFDTLLYMLLALGLNIVVGYTGLLDLGYIAFYGFGAYLYAALASAKFGIHWPTLAILPIVVVGTAALGFLVAIPSRRLVGDYLAIVTLFFGQLFVTVVNNGNRISVLGLTRGYDVTGGPNGIANLDPLHAFGYTFSSLRGYFWAALGCFIAVLAAVYLVGNSRTGRAWKSLREDSLAAELMGMPVNRLKLTAFACGAGVAGLTGILFASLQTAVFASDFDVTLLILVYAMLILGGAGSLRGVIIGAIVVNVALELLRTPQHATWIFFLLLLATILVKLRPWYWVPIVLGGTIVLGFVVRGIAELFWPDRTQGQGAVGGWIGRVLEHWLVLPTDPQKVGNWAFVALVVCVLALTTLRPLARNVLLIPTLYLAVFTWDTRLAAEPSITRLILIGVLLIALMNARPQGLVGSTRVEIV